MYIYVYIHAYMYKDVSMYVSWNCVGVGLQPE